MRKRILILFAVLVVCLLGALPVSASGWEEMPPRYYGLNMSGDSMYAFFDKDYPGLARCYVCVRGTSDTGYPTQVRYTFGAASRTVTIYNKSALCTAYNLQGQVYPQSGTAVLSATRLSGSASLNHPLVMAWEYVY